MEARSLVNPLKYLKRIVSRKADIPATSQFYFVSGFGREQGPGWDMGAEIKEGYESNSVVYACVRLIVTEAKRLPWNLFQRTRRGELREVEDSQHPLKVLLARPNPWQGMTRFMDDLWSYWLITGNSFILANRPLGQEARELSILRPNLMKITAGEAENQVASYRYMLTSQGLPYKAEDVCHMKLFRVEQQPLWGLSPIRVGARLIDQDNQAILWNWSLLKNRGRPDFLFVFKDGLTSQQRDEWKAWVDNMWSGASNAGKPVRIETDVEIKEVSKTPQEMDWSTTSAINNRRICQLYQVPPELIGDPQNKTYSNEQAARLALIEQIVFPMADDLKESLNSWLTPMFGEGLELDYDKDAVDAVVAKRATAFQRVQTADWLSINEQREATGYEAFPEEEADIPRALLQQRAIMSALVPPPEEEEEEPEEDDEETEESEDETETETTEEDNEAEETEEPKPEKAAKPAEQKRLRYPTQQVWRLKTEEQKAVAYAQVERQRRAFELFYRLQWAKHFAEERGQIQKAIAGVPAKEWEPEIKRILKVTQGKAESMLLGLYSTVGRYFFDRVRLSLPRAAKKSVVVGPVNGADLDHMFQVRMQRKQTALELLDMRRHFGGWSAEQAELIQETTADKLIKALRDGIFGGREDDAIAKSIEEIYDEQFIPNRSGAIASTEVISTSNYGTIEGAKATGLELKKYWITQRDDRVRSIAKGDSHDHTVADGQAREIEDAFVVTGEKLMWPGDDSLGAQPGNIINCRCYLAFDDE